MAGHGPAPKNPSRVARRNAPPVGVRVVEVRRGKQPTLAQVLGPTNPITGLPWAGATTRLWKQLADFPTTANLLPAQWSSLARGFMIDDALVRGDIKMAAEARLRFAKYGIDPDDLTRLRIQIVAADEADAKRPVAVADDEYADLRVVQAVVA